MVKNYLRWNKIVMKFPLIMLLMFIITLSTISTISTSTTTTINYNPIGWFDSADCTYFIGWACDQTDYSSTIEVAFYKGTQTGPETFLGSVIANQEREQAVGNECGGNRYHGFILPTPDSAKDGNSYIYAFAINMPLDGNPQLSGSPKILGPCVITTASTTTSTATSTTSTTTSTTSTTTILTTSTISSTTTTVYKDDNKKSIPEIGFGISFDLWPNLVDQSFNFSKIDLVQSSVSWGNSPYGSSTIKEFVRQNNPNSIILAYLSAITITGPKNLNTNEYIGDQCYDNSNIGNIGCYDWISQNHPEWFLTRSGQRIHGRPTSSYPYEAYTLDIGNLQYQQYWAEKALNKIKKENWDGIFMDEVWSGIVPWINIPSSCTNGNCICDQYPTTVKFKEAMRSFVKNVQEIFRQNGKLLIPNTMPEYYDLAKDGLMLEGFFHAASEWEGVNSPDGDVISSSSGYAGYNQISKFEEQLASVSLFPYSEKIILGSTYGPTFSVNDPDPVKTRKVAVFGLTSFLLAKPNNVKLFYTLQFAPPNRVAYVPEIDLAKKLGKATENYNHPLSSQIQIICQGANCGSYNANNVYLRHFENGIVIVSHTGSDSVTNITFKVNLGEPYLDINGNQVNSVNLWKHSGTILLKSGGWPSTTTTTTSKTTTSTTSTPSTTILTTTTAGKVITSTIITSIPKYTCSFKQSSGLFDWFKSLFGVTTGECEGTCSEGQECVMIEDNCECVDITTTTSVQITTSSSIKVQTTTTVPPGGNGGGNGGGGSQTTTTTSATGVNSITVLERITTITQKQTTTSLQEVTTNIPEEKSIINPKTIAIIGVAVIIPVILFIAVV